MIAVCAGFMEARPHLHFIRNVKREAFTAVPIENFYHSERSIAHYTLRARQCAYLFYFFNCLRYNYDKINGNLQLNEIKICGDEQYGFE